MKYLHFLIIAFTLVSCHNQTQNVGTENETHSEDLRTAADSSETDLESSLIVERTNEAITNKIEEAKKYCSEKNLNTNYAVLIDMSIHSGKYRMFIVDLQKDSIVKRGLCSHGCCESAWGSDWTAEAPTFSNVHESHCSSKGKYKIGKRGYSSWGINANYKLHGLEETNSNAFDRLIVLHSWDQVPNNELYPSGTPEGWGCPAVSNDFMRSLDTLIQSQNKSILLWIYN